MYKLENMITNRITPIYTLYDRWVLNGYFYPTGPLFLGYETHN